MMKNPLDHIHRPQLPWRTSTGVTECGIDASKVKTLTRDEYFQRLKDMGQQRTALFTCMTCSETAKRWGTWDDDPRKALEREIHWESAWRVNDRGVRLSDELIAAATLIQNHKDEFDALVDAIEQRREWNAKKEAAQSAKENPAKRGT